MSNKNHETSSNMKYSLPPDSKDSVSDEFIPIKMEVDLVDDAETDSSNKRFHFSREFCVQFTIAFFANLLSFIYGLHSGWIAPTILKLSSNNSEIPLTVDEISWLATMMPLGGCFGPIFGAFSANTFGRKTSLLMTAIPEIVTWIMIACATNSYFLFFAQFVNGAMGGFAMVVVPMYVGEISSPQFRGTFGMLLSTFTLAGFFFELILVPYVSIATNAWIVSVFPVILLIASLWMPESPYYLLMKNQPENARKSLQILKHNGNIDKQLECLKQIVEAEKKEVSSLYDMVRLKNNRVGFLMCLGVFSMQHLTGQIVLFSYGQSIMEKTNFVIKAHNCGIIIGAFGVISGIFGYLIIDSKGRRPLLLFATFGAMVSHFFIGIYFHLNSVNFESINSLTFLPFAGLLLNQLIASVALIPLPYLYLGETLSINIKGLASLILVSYASLMHSFLNKIFPQMCDILGIHIVLYFFVFGSFLCGIGTYFLLPETKGKTLDEIQKQFKKY